MTDRQPAECWLTDMDGVLVHEGIPVPGAQDFIQALEKSGKRYLVLTNNSIYTPRDLHARLRTSGIDVPADAIWTSALATAQFLDSQRPEGTAYTIGEAGLTTALHEIGYTLTDSTRTTWCSARPAATRSPRSPRRSGWSTAAPGSSRPTRTRPARPTEGALPATGSVAALITRATGVEPYFVGKPNPLMMRSALNNVGGHSETTAMIGDRMDTDIVAGMEAGLETVLVLTGVTTRAMIDRFPYRPQPGGRLDRRPGRRDLDRPQAAAGPRHIRKNGVPSGR